MIAGVRNLTLTRQSNNDMMGCMKKKLTTYLAGPINGCSDSEANDWRTEATGFLETDTKNPMDRDYRGRELEPGIAAEIVENDKDDIKDSDIVLIMFPVPSVGTSMETLFSWEIGKINVIVDKTNKPLSPWMIYHAHAVFKTNKEACDYINKIQRAYLESGTLPAING